MCGPYKTGLVLCNLGVSAGSLLSTEKCSNSLCWRLYTLAHPILPMLSILAFPYTRNSKFGDLNCLYRTLSYPLILTTPWVFSCHHPIFCEIKKTQEVIYSRLQIIKALQSKSQTTKFISFPSPLHSHSKTPSSLSADLLSFLKMHDYYSTSMSQIKLLFPRS